MKKWYSKKTRDLVKALVSLESEKEMKLFLRYLLTEKELLDLANRWKAARMLSDKKPHAHIKKRTGLSRRTIARIASWIENGMGSYRIMLSRLAKNHHTTPSQLEKKLP